MLTYYTSLGGIFKWIFICLFTITVHVTVTVMHKVGQDPQSFSSSAFVVHHRLSPHTLESSHMPPQNYIWIPTSLSSSFSCENESARVSRLITQDFIYRRWERRRSPWWCWWRRKQMKHSKNNDRGEGGKMCYLPGWKWRFSRMGCSWQTEKCSYPNSCSTSDVRIMSVTFLTFLS